MRTKGYKKQGSKTTSVIYVETYSRQMFDKIQGNQGTAIPFDVTRPASRAEIHFEFTTVCDFRNLRTIETLNIYIYIYVCHILSTYINTYLYNMIVSIILNIL